MNRKDARQRVEYLENLYTETMHNMHYMRLLSLFFPFTYKSYICHNDMAMRLEQEIRELRKIL